MRILITGACGVTPRAIARSLNMSPRFHDATVVGTDRGGNWYGFYEGLYDRVYLVPGVHDARYIEVMGGICRTEAIDVAVISPEAEVRFWSGREFPAPTLLPSPRFVRVAISKKNLYDVLSRSGLIPRYTIVTRDDLLDHCGLDFSAGPVWLRDFSDASSSGLGAIKVSDAQQAYAWASLNRGIAEYMVAEFLPGRNLACNLLFHNDKLLKVACYERLEYFQGQLVVSGVTGNISRGRLINDPKVRAVGEQAIRWICREHNEPAHGLFTVDQREAVDGLPKVTEINIRHTAGTSAFAAGGANLAEAQVLASLGRLDEIGDTVVEFSHENVILRDIDGPPLLVDDRNLEVGEFIERTTQRPAEFSFAAKSRDAADG